MQQKSSVRLIILCLFCRITGAKSEKNIHASVSEQLKKNFAKSRWRVSFSKYFVLCFQRPLSVIKLHLNGKIHISFEQILSWNTAFYYFSYSCSSHRYVLTVLANFSLLSSNNIIFVLKRF